MSDGMSDARAVGEIALELQRAADKLVQAIERAENGHRGLSVDICGVVNEVLPPTYRLQHQKQRERWE